VDPLTHTCVGAGLSAAGLRRTTALATPTLILAANAPDIDILTSFGAPYLSLELRRGLTHGVPALLVLPLFVTALILGWDRWIRRRRRPDADPARALPLWALANLGVWTHPVLDWLNTYGMRWLLPFDGRWSYGDAVFILDPWLWLLLVGPTFLFWSSGAGARMLWALLALALSLPVLLAEMVPGWARVLWIAGIGSWILLRLRHRSGSEDAQRIVRACLIVAGLYLAAMVGQGSLTSSIVQEEAGGSEVVEALMVGPLPADPFGAQVVVQEAESYRTGEFRWNRRPRVRWNAESLPRLEVTGDRDTLAMIATAREHPEARRYLAWARFPIFRVGVDLSAVCQVKLLDARYVDRGNGGGALSGPRVQVPCPTPPASTP
jgi:inner membrane protein